MERNFFRIRTSQILLLMLVVLFVGSLSGYAQTAKDTLNMARQAYNDGNYKKSLKYYKKVEKGTQQPLTLNQEIAQTEYKLKHFDEAAKRYKSLASFSTKKKDQSVLSSNAGNAEINEKAYDDAIVSFKDALRKNPNNEQARQLLQEAKRLKKKQEAEKKKQNQPKNEENNKEQKQDQQNQQQNGQQPQNKQRGNKSNGDNKQNSPEKANQDTEKGSMKDKETDRKLDELARQEMGTKRRLSGMEGGRGKSMNRSGKNW